MIAMSHCERKNPVFSISTEENELEYSINKLWFFAFCVNLEIFNTFYNVPER